MTLAEAFKRVCSILKTLSNGEIHLVVRKGEIKYVNVLQEYLPREAEDDEKRGKI